jgi:hypothetical protein
MTSLKFFLLNISVLIGVLGEYSCANEAFTNMRCQRGSRQEFFYKLAQTENLRTTLRLSC